MNTMKSKIRLTTKLYGFSVLCCCLCFSILINTNMHNSKNELKGKMIEENSPVIEKVALQNPVYFTVFSKVLNS